MASFKQKHISFTCLGVFDLKTMEWDKIYFNIIFLLIILLLTNKELNQTDISLRLIFYCSSFLQNFTQKKTQVKKPKKGSVTTNHCYAATQKKSQNPSKISQKKPQKFIQKNWLGINYFNSKMDKKWALVFRRVLAKKSTKFV